MLAPTLVLLALCGGCALLLWWRQLKQSQQAHGMRIRSRMALDSRHALFLVEVNGRELLLGTSEAGVTLLDAREAARPVMQKVA